MAKRSFVINTDHEINQVVERVEEFIVKEGGDFEGDCDAGCFSGHTSLGFFNGRYTVDGQDITIEVVKKPLLVPMIAIEESVRKLFKNAK